MDNQILFTYFAAGFLTCMLSDLVFSICNFLIQKSFYFRSERKNNHENQSNSRHPEDRQDR